MGIELPHLTGCLGPSLFPPSDTAPIAIRTRQRTPSEISCAETLGELSIRFANTVVDQALLPRQTAVHPTAISIKSEDTTSVREEIAQPVTMRLPSIHELVGSLSSLSGHNRQSQYDWRASRHASFSSTASGGGPLYQLPPASPSTSSNSSFVGSNGYSTPCISPAGSWQQSLGFIGFTNPFEPQDKPTVYGSVSRVSPDIQSYHHVGPDRSYFSSRRSSRKEPYYIPSRGSHMQWSADSDGDWVMIGRPQFVSSMPERRGVMKRGGNQSEKKKRGSTVAHSREKRKKRDNTPYTFEQEIFITYHVVDLGLTWAEVEKRYNLWFHDPNLTRNQAGLTCEYYRNNLTMPMVGPDGLLDLGPFRLGEKDVSKEMYKGARYRTKTRKCRRDKVPLAVRWPEELVDPQNLWVLREHREDPYVIRIGKCFLSRHQPTSQINELVAHMRKMQREAFLSQYPQIEYPYFIGR